MTSIIRIFFPDFEPPATVEDSGVPAVLTEPITDTEDYGRGIEEILELGTRRLGQQHPTVESGGLAAGDAS
jgi:hypothetical protein